MSLYRRAARRDQSEAAIVEAFRAAGCHVLRHSATGEPDLIVWRGDGRFLALVEVKRTRAHGDRQGRATLTPAQVKWRASWGGPAPIRVETPEQALNLLRAAPGAVLARSRGSLEGLADAAI